MAVHVDVVADFDRRSTRTVAQQISGQFSQAGQDASRGFAAGIGRDMPKVEKAFNRAADSAGKLRVEQEKLNQLQRDGVTDTNRLVTAQERVAKAYRDNVSAIRSVQSAMNDHHSSLRRIGEATDDAGVGIRTLGANIGALGKIGGPVALAVIAKGLYDVAGIAVNASKSLLLVPAAVGAAAAAFGTLKLATLGFSDALDAMGDPEKFAEALQSLSPNAQQAALSIKALVDGPLKELKTATQDALFAGVGGQLEALTSTLLPTVRQTTTGIAAAFNKMFSGVTTQLMTPETQGALQEFATNTVQAFQNLAPAAAPFVKAMGELAAAGSDFLPQLANSISDATAKFAEFITEASESGKIHEWIQTGIDTLASLKDMTVDAGRILVTVFGPGSNGKSAIEGMAQSTHELADALEKVWDLVEKVGNAFGVISSVLQGNLPGALRDLRDLSSGTTAGRATAPPGVGGSRSDAARAGAAIGAMAAPGTVRPVPQPTPKGPEGPKPHPFFPESQWQVGPGGVLIPPGQATTGGAPAVTPGQIMFGTGGQPGEKPGPGYFQQDQGAILDAQDRLAGAQESLSESRLRVLELEAEGNVAQSSLVAAKNNVLQQERALRNAERDLAEATQGTWKKLEDSATKFNDGMVEIGAALDQDLGISKGLPGIAENLTKFIANLAFAPALGAMGAVVQAGGGLKDSGSGLFGLGATSGVFGQRFMPQTQGGFAPVAGAAGVNLQPLTTASRSAGLSGYVGDAALLANVPAGRYTQSERGDLTQGLADCSSAVEDLVNLLDQRPTSGASMWTGNAADWLSNRGFQPGMGGPGDFRVGFNSEHMQATLPGGTPFNWGSSAAASARGIGGTGADDPALTSHYYRPTGAATSTAPVAGGGGFIPLTSAPLTNPATTNPVLITGGTGEGAGIPGMAGPPQAAGAAPVPMPFGGAAPAPQAGPTRIGGISPAGAPGGGGGGSGGLLGGIPMAAIQTGIQAGALAIDSQAPGAGEAAAIAAKIGIDLANRAAAQVGKYAGIAVGGVMETALPFGASELADPNRSWFGRIASGLAGARPALPNISGQQTKEGQLPPDQQAAMAGQHGATKGAPPGPTNGVYIENYQVQANEDRAGADLARHQMAAAAPPGGH